MCISICAEYPGGNILYIDKIDKKYVVTEYDINLIIYNNVQSLSMDHKICLTCRNTPKHMILMDRLWFYI